MRNHKWLVVSLGVLLGWVAGFVSPSRAADPPALETKKCVLVVHSYHASQTGHVYQMTQGIEEALDGSGAWLVYFHMDTKRNKQTAWKQQAGRMAAQVADRIEPDVVITMDDNAQAFFARDFTTRPGAPPVVFAGVNADPAKYGFPTRNVTGVIERPNIKESLDLLRKIVPGVETVAMLSDRSPTTSSTWEYARTLDLPVTVAAYEQPLTFDEWKAVIARYKGRVDAFGLYVIRTIQRSATDTTHVPEAELVAYLLENTNLPTVGFFDTSAQAGILCGVSVSMKEQGFKAGRLARTILEGRLPAEIPVSPTTKGRILLNLKTAERLGVEVTYNIISRATEVIK